MVNSQPCLFAQVVTQAVGAEMTPAILNEYAFDRSGVFAKVRTHSGFENTTDEQLKTMFIICLTSEPGTVLRHNGHISPAVSAYKAAVDSMANLLSKMTPFTSTLKLASASEKPNKMGRFVTYVCARAERKVLFALKNFFEENGHTVGVLIHDGLYVERESDLDQWLPASLLAQAEYKIKETTGFRVVLAEKSLKPTEEDMAILDGPKQLKKIKTDFLRCVYLLSRSAKLQKLKRMDDNVYRPHPSIPGVYVPAEEHLEFINKTLLTSPYFMSVKTDDLTTWMKTKDHVHFELLCVSKFANVIAFRNGCYDLESLQFSRYVQNSKKEWTLENGKPAPMTIQFYDKEFNVSEQNLSTPLWDKLISTQIKQRSTCKVCGHPGKYSVEEKLEHPADQKTEEDEEEDETEEGKEKKKKYTTYCSEHAPAERQDLVLAGMDIFEILVGRLLYPTKAHDNWQIMLFLKGDSNSGKSTILNILTQFFPEGSVGCITSTTEGTFGLESLFNKRLVLFPDMSESIGKNLQKETWQSMVSGEKVSVAQKHKKALADKPWRVPLAACANGFPNWKDTSGAVQRRMGVFLWSEPIAQRDSSMEQRIIAEELVAVLLRCVTAYRAACDRFTGGDFWKRVATGIMKDAQKVVIEESSPLSAFLMNGNEFYQIAYEEGHSETVEALEKAYANHCRYVLKYSAEQSKLGKDRHPLTRLGFKMVTKNKCKVCPAIPATSKSCGDHYRGGKNRSQTKCIENMRIVKKLSLHEQQQKEYNDRIQQALAIRNKK